ncbi:MAG TPA: DUF2062 domain-containing protein [Bryobacteraceae bacterium]|jgi:uncharacterized protein (DUF2062 family)|nr:DUF2062 domain-containing protein [Bryobacteraceae bacterium]
MGSLAALRSAIHRKLVQPFIDLLKQGVTPEKIALTIALGVSLGVIPVIGSTTMLCTVAAVTLRLNLPGIMLINGLVYPLQLALLVPFLRAGAWIFRVDGPKLTIGQIFTLIRTDMWHTITTLWVATMHALVIWLIAGCAVSSIVYLVLAVVLRRFWVVTHDAH